MADFSPASYENCNDGMNSPWYESPGYKKSMVQKVDKDLGVVNNDPQFLGLERYWHWVIGYWAIFAVIG